MRPRSFYVGFPPAIVKIAARRRSSTASARSRSAATCDPRHEPAAPGDLARSWRRRCARTPELVPSSCSGSARARGRGLRRRARGAAELARRGRARVAVAGRPQVRRPRAARSSRRGRGPDAYWRQPTWKRIAVIAAGPAANILARVRHLLRRLRTGRPVAARARTVGQVVVGHARGRAGLQPGDRVLAVDGRARRRSKEIPARIRASHGRPFTLTVRPRTARRVTLGPVQTVKLDGRPTGSGASRPSRAAVRRSPLRHSVPATAVRAAGRSPPSTVQRSIGPLRHRTRHGPGRRARSGSSAISTQALDRWLQTGTCRSSAFVSLSLALLNLLPLLPLDGGHIAVLARSRRSAAARSRARSTSASPWSAFALILLLVRDRALDRTSPH